MDLELVSDEEIIEEIQKRFNIFIMCGRKDNAPVEDCLGQMDASLNDATNKKYRRLELMQWGNDIFGSLGLLEIVFEETEILNTAQEIKTIAMMLDSCKDKDEK